MMLVHMSRRLDRGPGGWLRAVAQVSGKGQSNIPWLSKVWVPNVVMRPRKHISLFSQTHRVRIQGAVSDQSVSSLEDAVFVRLMKSRLQDRTSCRWVFTKISVHVWKGTVGIQIVPVTKSRNAFRIAKLNSC